MQLVTGVNVAMRIYERNVDLEVDSLYFMTSHLVIGCVWLRVPGRGLFRLFRLDESSLCAPPTSYTENKHLRPEPVLSARPASLWLLVARESPSCLACVWALTAINGLCQCVLLLLCRLICGCLHSSSGSRRSPLSPRVPKAFRLCRFESFGLLPVHALSAATVPAMASVVWLDSTNPPLQSTVWT